MPSSNARRYLLVVLGTLLLTRVQCRYVESINSSKQAVTGQEEEESRHLRYYYYKNYRPYNNYARHYYNYYYNRKRTRAYYDDDCRNCNNDVDDNVDEEADEGDDGDDEGDDGDDEGDDEGNDVDDTDDQYYASSNVIVRAEKMAEEKFWELYKNPPSDWNSSQWGFFGGLIASLIGYLIFCYICCKCCCGRNREGKEYMDDYTSAASTHTSFQDDMTYDSIMRLRSKESKV